MLLVILMQRPKSEGLGTSFGSGFTENILGAGATDFLVRITSYLGAGFFILSMALAYLYAHQFTGQTATQRSLLNTKMPAVAPLPPRSEEPQSGMQPQATIPPTEATPEPTAPLPTAPAPTNP